MCIENSFLPVSSSWMPHCTGTGLIKAISNTFSSMCAPSAYIFANIFFLPVQVRAADTTVEHYPVGTGIYGKASGCLTKILVNFHIKIRGEKIVEIQMLFRNYHHAQAHCWLKNMALSRTCRLNTRWSSQCVKTFCNNLHLYNGIVNTHDNDTMFKQDINKKMCDC